MPDEKRRNSTVVDGTYGSLSINRQGPDDLGRRTVLNKE